MKPIFICYNKHLKNFLRKNGQISWCSGINENSKSKFWVFMNTKELDNLIKKYKDKYNN